MMGSKLRDEAWRAIESGAVPANLVAALIVVADLTTDEPRRFYGSVATVALRSGKSVQQARRDLHRLIEIDAIELVTTGGGASPSLYYVTPLRVIERGRE